MTVYEKMIVLMKFGKFCHTPQVGFCFEINPENYPFFNRVKGTTPTDDSLPALVNDLFGYIIMDCTSTK